MSIDDIVPAADRLAVPISAHAALGLVEHLAEQLRRPKAVQLAWDLRRTDDDELGFDTFTQAIALFGEAPCDCNRDAWFDQQWAIVDRRRRPGDVLLIDTMDNATHDGWIAPPEIFFELERLRHIGEQRRAEKKTQAKARQAAEVERRREIADAEIETLRSRINRLLEREPEGELRKLLTMALEHIQKTPNLPEVMQIIEEREVWAGEIKALDESARLQGLAIQNAVLRQATMANLGGGRGIQ